MATQSAHTVPNIVENPNDIDYNKPARGKFMFHLFFLGFFVFIGGCSYALWTHSYKSTGGVAVPESTTYNPKYK